MTNVDTIKELYRRFALRDNESIRELFDANIRWKQMDGFPSGGEYTGADAIFANVFDGFKDKWESWKAVVTAYLDAGNDVIAIGYYEGSYRQTGISMRAAFAHRYTLGNGRVVRFEQYTDTAMVARAMGGFDAKVSQSLV